MRIGVLAYKSINAKYRAYIPARELHRAGHVVHYEETTARARDPEAFRACDVVVLYRLQSKEIETFARWLKAGGVAVVWDNDDRFRQVPRGRQEFKVLEGLRGHRIQRGIEAMLRIADVVSTSSCELAQEYSDAGTDRVRIVENYLPPEFISGTHRKPHDGLVVGWVAAREHRFDVEMLNLEQTLAGVLHSVPEARVVTIGLRLSLPPDRYRHLPKVDFAQLATALADFDVGIAPIAESEFNAARSNVKIKEYAAVGLPWLASDRGAYRGLGEREGGRLVGDERWQAEITDLLGSERQRRRLGKRSKRWAESQLIGRHIARWEGVLEEAVARSSGNHAS